MGGETTMGKFENALKALRTLLSKFGSSSVSVSEKLKSEGFSEEHYLDFPLQIANLVALAPIDSDDTPDNDKKFAKKIKNIIGDTTFNIWVENVWTDETQIKTSWQRLDLKKKQECLNIAGKYVGGNCWELSNFFVRKNETPKSKDSTKGVETVQKVLNKYNSLIFRIGLGNSHTFAGIKINGNVEIFQAWQGHYAIKQWLSKNNNSFSLTNFKSLLFEITSNLNKANKFFSAKGVSIKLTSVPIITSFSYKLLNDLEIDELKENALNFLKEERIADKTYTFQ
jgi:hypothetical protein